MGVSTIDLGSVNGGIIKTVRHTSGDDVSSLGYVKSKLKEIEGFTPVGVIQAFASNPTSSFVGNAFFENGYVLLRVDKLNNGPSTYGMEVLYVKDEAIVKS